MYLRLLSEYLTFQAKFVIRIENKLWTNLNPYNRCRYVVALRKKLVSVEIGHRVLVYYDA